MVSMASINANAALCFGKMMDSVGHRGYSVIWTTGVKYLSTHMKIYKLLSVFSFMNISRCYSDMFFKITYFFSINREIQLKFNSDLYLSRFKQKDFPKF